MTEYADPDDETTCFISALPARRPSMTNCAAGSRDDRPLGLTPAAAELPADWSLIPTYMGCDTSAGRRCSVAALQSANGLAAEASVRDPGDICVCV